MDKINILKNKKRKTAKKKESQSQQGAGYSLSLKLGNNCRARVRGITPSLSNKRRNQAIDKVALIRHLPKQCSFTDRGHNDSMYINLSKRKRRESASVDLMVRHLSDKQGSFTGIPGSIPGVGASIPLFIVGKK